MNQRVVRWWGLAPLGRSRKSKCRQFDPLPVVRSHVYHPAFAGPYSLKYVLPALILQMTYEGMGSGKARMLGSVESASARQLEPNRAGQNREGAADESLTPTALDRSPSEGQTGSDSAPEVGFEDMIAQAVNQHAQPDGISSNAVFWIVSVVRDMPSRIDRIRCKVLRYNDTHGWP
jgi:hypothetical protein